MAPVLSKFSVAVVTASVTFLSLTYLSYFIYKFFERPNEPENANDAEDENDGENRFQKLVKALESQDVRVVLEALRKLGNLTAFKEFQVLIREYCGLQKIVSLLGLDSLDIKIQALNVINNLAMDMENQVVLRNTIPYLVDMLHAPAVSSERMSLAVTRVLTNLTTLDENHDLLLPHLLHLFELLKISAHPIKLQVLKILINLSTNQNNVENLLDVDLQIISAIDEFVAFAVEEDLLLRAVSCLANILSPLNNKWQRSNKKLVSTSEFVAADMEARLEELLHHSNEEIQRKSQIALSALKEAEDCAQNCSATDIDIVEALQL